MSTFNKTQTTSTTDDILLLRPKTNKINEYVDEHLADWTNIRHQKLRDKWIKMKAFIWNVGRHERLRILPLLSWKKEIWRIRLNFQFLNGIVDIFDEQWVLIWQWKRKILLQKTVWMTFLKLENRSFLMISLCILSPLIWVSRKTLYWTYLRSRMQNLKR